ncbi:hypothetical protein [Terriglobus sp.]|uniref:hypothetical protein n=1 Tax=Terriglobus sp. TaxID=1889013 RepID=UPI003AFFB7FA
MDLSGGYPHSIQGTGADGCEFLLVFNQGRFSEEDTFLLSDWLMHTPPDVLEKNFGLDADAIAKLPKGDPLYIFPNTEPTQTYRRTKIGSIPCPAPRSLLLQGRLWIHFSI